MTHVPAALRTGMLGQRLRKRDNRTFSSLLPASPVCSETDQRSKVRQQCHPVRSQHLETAFRSPATTICCQIPIARSVLLACFFDVRRNSSRTRSADDSPTSSGLPRIKRDQRHEPVARSLFPRFRRLLNLHFPQGTAKSPSDRSVQSSLPPKKLTCINRPIPLRSPPASYFVISLRINVPGSLRLTKFDCSMNLLEP